MPMGIVSDNEFESELNNCNKEHKYNLPQIKNAEVITIPTKGRKENDVNVPDALRKLIGESGALGDRVGALSIAKEFDISPSSVSAYSHGSTSTKSYNTPDKGIKAFIESRKDKLSKRAMHRLNLALKEITPEKLSGAKVRDIAGVAKDMSLIMKNMEPDRDSGSQNNNVQFVFMTPPVKSEESYEVIHVRE